MSSHTDHKLGLPQLNSSVASSLVIEKNPSLSVIPKIKMPRDLLFFRQAGGMESSPVNHQNPKKKQENLLSTELNPNAEANKIKNLKIDDLIKKASKKLNFSNKDKAKKFEDKLKIFENLSTFIDIKDFLQQMNPLNNEIPKRNIKLPPIHNADELIRQNSPTSSNPSFTLRKHDSMASPSFGKITTRNKSLGTNSASVDGEIPDKLKSLRSHISKFAATKEESALNSERKKDTYGLILDKANIMLTQLNEADLKSPIIEDTDVNNFYQELQGNLVNNNFEKVDYGHYRLQQDEMDYYKNLLTFKEEESEAIDQKYYDAYKARAEKVIVLLRKATKNIYKKVFEEKKGVRSRTNGELTERDNKDLKNAKGAEVKEYLKQQFEVFVSANQFMHEYQKEVTPDLQVQFIKMLRRVNSIVGASKANNKVNSMIDDDTENNNNLNHEINKMHKTFMKTILECADHQGNNYKTMKEDFKKKIDKLEDAYDKDIQRILPKNLESIKMTLDINSANKRYINQPLKKNLSRKMLNALNN